MSHVHSTADEKFWGQHPTVLDALRYRAQLSADAVACTFLEDGEALERRLTYSEIEQRSLRAADALHAAGLGPGDRALLLYPDGLSFIVGLFACFQAGVVAVPAYPPDPARIERTLTRLVGIVRDSFCGAILTTRDVLAMREEISERAPGLADLSWVSSDGVDAGAPASPGMNAVRGDLALLQYTSGSTGTPKGVMITHGNLACNQRMIATAVPTASSARSG